MATAILNHSVSSLTTCVALRICASSLSTNRLAAPLADSFVGLDIDISVILSSYFVIAYLA
jgi:hypothetical protein